MNKQTKLNWQTIVFAAIASLIFMFAIPSNASAQTPYKVGDRVETMSAYPMFGRVQRIFVPRRLLRQPTIKVTLTIKPKKIPVKE